MIDPQSRRVETLIGGADEFFEPGGVSHAAGQLFIADTNHHAIKVVEIGSGAVEAIDLDPASRHRPKESSSGH